MHLGQVIGALAGVVVRPARRRGGGGVASSNVVFLVLGLVVVIGGGRRWLQSWRARRAVELLNDPAVTPEAVRSMSAHGREGLMDLFRLLGTAPDPAIRDAAGLALADLWARDQLVAEEEKAIVRRGFVVNWRARRRYPRAIRGPIPITVSYGVSFLRDGEGVGPSQLEWSHRVMGTERVTLEEFGPWRAGPGLAAFALQPEDFPTNGPHRLVLESRVRTKGLTDPWELDLPHIPFSFEFDPILAVESLLTLPDDARAEEIARRVRLDRPKPSRGKTPFLEPDTDPDFVEVAPGKLKGEEPSYLNLNADLALRDPPIITVETPLPCDLGHAVALEFEDVPGRFAAGQVVLSGQGIGEAGVSVRRFPIGPIVGLPPEAIDRTGERRLRVILTADPDLGWADPDVRSLWPGTITTDWATVRVVRR